MPILDLFDDSTIPSTHTVPVRTKPQIIQHTDKYVVEYLNTLQKVIHKKSYRFESPIILPDEEYIYAEWVNSQDSINRILRLTFTLSGVPLTIECIENSKQIYHDTLGNMELFSSYWEWLNFLKTE